MYLWDWGVVSDHQGIFLDGALTTAWLSFLCICVGTVLGIGLGLLRRSRIRLVSVATKVVIDVLRALPILVLLVWLYYVAPIYLPWRFTPFEAALIALSLNLAAFVAETVRAGIEAVPKHQFESGLVLGLSKSQVMIRIIAPQSLRNILPNLMGLYITQLKNTSLASIIAVNELLHRANILISDTFRPLEIYTAVAVTYLMLILPCTAFAQWIEVRLAKRQPLWTPFLSYKTLRNVLMPRPHAPASKG